MNDIVKPSDDKENDPSKLPNGHHLPNENPSRNHAEPLQTISGHETSTWEDSKAVKSIKPPPGHDDSQDAEIEARNSRGNHTQVISSPSASPSKGAGDVGGILKLSPQQIKDLTSSPGSLPFKAATPIDEEAPFLIDGPVLPASKGTLQTDDVSTLESSIRYRGPTSANSSARSPHATFDVAATKGLPGGVVMDRRPSKTGRSTSSPTLQRKPSSLGSRSRPNVPPLKTDGSEFAETGASAKQSGKRESTAHPSPISSILPIPPMSLPTYLQLELSSDRPSPLYIRRPPGSDFPYESSEVKFERLLNFFRLPPQLEQVLWFGALVCLDSWLYTFTIMPLRFLKAVGMLLQWLGQNSAKEALDLWTFVYEGVGRVWRRRRESGTGASRRPAMDDITSHRPPLSSRMHSAVSPGLQSVPPSSPELPRRRSGFRHRRTRSTPSGLLPNHKADILQGLLIILSCIILMWFDASRMYHSIRGQAAIKLYVIYNVLEVFDRLFSALGQDVLECLFSKETLERDSNGRSKIIRPLWMFGLALAYNIIHAAALFYQVVTLNVAVNSYSNALLTLLMSNQFVEIKGTVFKKFEKENLFQLTCADVVERFQLWLMLLIIALRNIVEVGGLSISLSSSPLTATPSASASAAANATSLPVSGGGVLPKALTLIPYWTGEVLGPFLIVLGSEMLVDWLKHAYITKFNNIKPNIYGRFLDVLAKDYYSHVFADQNLTKRLGLPVIPLSCLFIRASVQTYHMFLATHVPIPFPSTATSVSIDNGSTVTSQATMKALEHVDHIFRRALNRSSFGAGNGQVAGAFYWWSIDDVIALATMGIFFLALYLLLLALKLVLGMLLLSFARNRYKGMRARERQSTEARGRRLGGWGTVEVGEDRRRWIYDDDPDGLREAQAREAKVKARAEKNEMNLDNVDRYTMAAKRIW